MKLKKKISAICAVMLIFFSLVLTGSPIVAKAEKKTYDTSNVIEDLSGFQINGKDFDVFSYELDITKTSPEMITFVEYKFSVVPELKKDLGYYIYLYNPTGKEIQESGNFVSIGFGEEIKTEGYRYLPLKILSVENGKLKDYAFYKFKVDFSFFDSSYLYSALNTYKRDYQIVDITLNLSNETDSSGVSINVGWDYTFTGFVKGYALEGDLDDSLSYSKGFVEEILQPKVTHTFFRPSGTKRKIGVSPGGLLDSYYSVQDSLHSVYFSIPNDYLSKYDRFESVHASWYSARLKPVLVSGNTGLNEAIEDFLGKDLTIEKNNKDYRSKVPYMVFGDFSTVNDSFKAAYSFGCLDKGFWLPGLQYIATTDNWIGTVVNPLYLLFKCQGVNAADNYTVTGKELQDKIIEYSNKVSSIKILDKYAACLFNSCNFVDKRIHSSELYTLMSRKFSDDWFKNCLGIKDYTEYNCLAIEAVDYDELQKLKKAPFSESVISEKYFVDINDVSDFISVCEKNYVNNETTYLFRYELSDYVSAEATIFKKGLFSVFDRDGDNATNAYFAEETVNLNFDIIDIGFEKEGEDYFIPCVMDPVDFFPDITPPPQTESDDSTDKPGCNGSWQQILGLILFLLLLVVLFPFLGPVLNVLGAIFKVIITIIAFPFKMVVKLFVNRKTDKPKKDKKKRN